MLTNRSSNVPSMRWIAERGRRGSASVSLRIKVCYQKVEMLTLEY